MQDTSELDHKQTNGQHTGNLSESHLLRNLANLDVRTIYRALLTSELGLTDLQVQHARRQYGINAIAHEALVPWYRRLVHYCRNPFILVLLIIGTVSVLTRM